MEQDRPSCASVPDTQQETDTDGQRQLEALNLSYLLVVQRLMRENEAEALFRLGLGREMGRLLASLTPTQIIALARSSLMRYRFRLDDGLLVAALTGAEPLHALHGMHAAIVMASRRD
ncbi:flagellar transcriptional regulator FlhD [Cupriavidus alkaliphilus]|uniref:Flagellar transcriptional activator FlhD n=1 Tax=Cupriavidus alkaliphilus TaxID=942866 RepID=A0A7W4YS59_9BURK|nr:flagellar transcriptional regulator FlhD [Cupriavidus alkaliphilus]MBB3007801.1 flagellar transcriptional activator FlhD [Cupriavidus alkaliphilus]PVY70963.1 flagellar transcriptional activator FlhD [Cupriavidus alkaliphilus]SCB30643.1 flagellar transcriptional activator FlhD [Cupriavidus alkaliphilus]